MLKSLILLTVLGLALSIAQGCANNPPSSNQTLPSYINGDCSAQSQYEKKSCIPAPPPSPPTILDYN
ncbi:MAG: hypothetical protein WAV07_05480 [Candidatus Contendobacter sp.]